MAFTIRDRNNNGITMLNDRNKTALFMSLKCATDELKQLPSWYWIRDEITKKKVAPL